MISTNPSGSVGLERNVCVCEWVSVFVCVLGVDRVCACVCCFYEGHSVAKNMYFSELDRVWRKQSCIRERPKDICIALRLLFIAQEL